MRMEYCSQTHKTNYFFSVSGPGVIAGVDNADIKDPDPYSGTTRKAWHGRALVVVRSTRDAGNIKLTVSSEGITDASVMINADLK